MCTSPIKLLITRKDTGDKEWIEAPCGQCPTCIRRRASDWTIKLINEAKYHKECSFITLTFSNEILLDKNSKAVKEYGAQANFPYNIAYSKKYFQKFMKRLRKKFPEKKITYYHIAEYGEIGHRAHHHVLLFGCDFREDTVQCELSKSGKPMLYSQTLEDLWACGRTRIQLVNDNNIAYIAGYSNKKRPLRMIFDEQKNDKENFEIFKKVIDNFKKWKPLQSFSNRSKMSVKFIRKRPELLRDQEFLTDKDGKKYAFPKSYIREMKLETEKEQFCSNPLFIQSYQSYDERRANFIGELPDRQTYLTQQKIKETIYYKRASKKQRDF